MRLCCSQDRQSRRISTTKPRQQAFTPCVLRRFPSPPCDKMAGMPPMRKWRPRWLGNDPDIGVEILPPHVMTTTHRRRLVASVLLVCLLTGCGAAPASTAEAISSTRPTAALINCGVPVDLDGNPERIMTLKSSTTELVLALGLQDRLVGTADLDGPVPDHLRQGELPVISEGLTSKEAVLQLRPDVILSGWESALTGQNIGERSSLHRSGIATYVPPAACRGHEQAPAHLTFDDVFAYIEEAGRLLGASGAAQHLVQNQRAELAAQPRHGAHRTVFWYSSGQEQPYAGAGDGIPQVLIERTGLRNVLENLDGGWTSVGWEALVRADPDIIVLVDSPWSPAAAKRHTLETHPATSTLTAVRQQHYVIVPFAATEIGVRNVEAVQTLNDQLAKIESS